MKVASRIVNALLEAARSQIRTFDGFRVTSYPHRPGTTKYTTSWVKAPYTLDRPRITKAGKALLKAVEEDGLTAIGRPQEDVPRAYPDGSMPPSRAETVTVVAK